MRPVGFDDEAAGDAIAVLARAQDGAGSTRVGTLRVFDNMVLAGVPVPADAAAVPETVHVYALWCGYEIRDLTRRRGQAEIAEQPPSPMPTLFPDADAARRAGVRDAKRVRRLITRLGAGEISTAEFSEKTSELTTRSQDPAYAAAYAAEFTTQEYLALSADALRYDADHNGVLDGDELAAYRQDRGAALAPVAAAERAGSLPASASPLGLPASVVAMVTGVAAFSSRFLVAAAQQVLGTDVAGSRSRVLAKIQMLFAIAGNPAAAREVVGDQTVLAAARALANAGPPPADAATAALGQVAFSAVLRAADEPSAARAGEAGGDIPARPESRSN